MNFPAGCMGVDPKYSKRPCAMGVDIRPDSWDVAILDIWKSPATGIQVPRLVFYGKLDDEEQVYAVAPWYGVACSVLDSRPEATLASRLQRRLQSIGIDCWRAGYNTTPSDVKMREDHVEGRLSIDRTLTLDDIHYSMMTGGMSLPQNYRDICGGQFKDEMTCSSRVPWLHAGRQWSRWVERGPDHAFHAMNYAVVAIAVGRLMTYGGEHTMGATTGIVESILSKNIQTPQELEQQEDLLDGVMTWVA